MSDEPMPPSPMSALAATAAQTHEMYRSYVDAGFTEVQAMQIICAMLTAMLRGGS